MSRLSFAVASALTHSAALGLGLFRRLERWDLTEGECQERGLPEGSTVPAVALQRITGAPWWRFGVWAEDGCLNVRAVGWWGEVFYQPKASASSKATARPQ